MSIICKMNGALLTAPCSASACHFFGDCITDWKKTMARPQTHGDRFRALTDEELAEILFRLYRVTVNGVEMPDVSLHWCDGKNDCIDAAGNIECDEARNKDCILRWLRSAVAEG